MILLEEIRKQPENCLKCKFWKKDAHTEAFLEDEEDEVDICDSDLSGECRRRATWPTTYANDFCEDFIENIKVETLVEESTDDSYLDTELSEILSWEENISGRLKGALRGNLKFQLGINTIRELNTTSDSKILTMDNFGTESVSALRELVKRYCLSRVQWGGKSIL